MSPISPIRLLYDRRWPVVLFLVLWVTACADRTGTRSVPPIPPPASALLQADVAAIRFTIQVGAFSTAERAARYAEYLESVGLDAYYFIDSDGLHKARFGRFDTKADARQRAMALQAHGVIDDFYVVQPGPSEDGIVVRATLQEGLVKTANRFVGTPYRWGGTSVRTGFDCSGLTMTVYRLNGMELPRTSASQFQTGTPVSKSALNHGDLVFFATGRKGRVSHVGIYSGRGKFIHAPGRGKHIRAASLSNSYFKTRYMGARRYF